MIGDLLNHVCRQSHRPQIRKKGYRRPMKILLGPKPLNS